MSNIQWDRAKEFAEAAKKALMEQKLKREWRKLRKQSRRDAVKAEEVRRRRKASQEFLDALERDRRLQELCEAMKANPQ